MDLLQLKTDCFIKKCIAIKIHWCAHYWKHAGMIVFQYLLLTCSRRWVGHECRHHFLTSVPVCPVFVVFGVTVFHSLLSDYKRECASHPPPLPFLVFDYQCEVAAPSSPLCFLTIRVWLGCKCMHTFEDRMQMLDGRGGGWGWFC